MSAPLQAVAIESSTSRSGGPAWGVRPRFIVDLVLTVSFVSLMSVPFTGLPLHEWWGIGLIAVIVLHLPAQWDWTIASTRRVLGALTGRLRFTYVLNWLLFIAMVLVMVSGILISEAALPSVGLTDQELGVRDAVAVNAGGVSGIQELSTVAGKVACPQLADSGG